VSKKPKHHSEAAVVRSSGGVPSPTDFNKPNEGELILYQTQEGAVRIKVLYESETFWLNQRKIAELFGVELPTISYHLKEIYDSGELSRESTLRRIRRVQKEGNREVTREIEFYNLDTIISVGYRVNSTQATRFRIWAPQTLREFVIKGFVLDDERLKLNKRFGKDYFDELLERIREIRASERRFVVGQFPCLIAIQKVSRRIDVSPCAARCRRQDLNLHSLNGN
jgi:hypothetical protein